MSNPTDTIKKAIFFGHDIDESVEHIKAVGTINLSTLIRDTSHALIDNCYELYTPCHVGEWIRYNPELYDTEINFYKQLLNECGDNIVIDVEPYTAVEINTYLHVSDVSIDDGIPQIYTVCLME